MSIIRPTIHWRFLCQKRNGTTYLHTLEILPGDTGSLIMSKLRTEYSRVSVKPPYTIWDRTNLFWALRLEVALLSQYCLADLEAQKTPPSRVIAADSVPDLELTAAFQQPGIPFVAEDFVAGNKRFAVNPTGSCEVEGRYAIMIRQGLNRLAVWMLILGGALCCILAGVLVGALTKSADLGIAVTSGISAVVACAEGLIFWAYK